MKPIQSFNLKNIINNRLIKDYLAEKTTLSGFTPYFFNKESILKKIKERGEYPVDRNTLAKVLMQQNTSHKQEVIQNIQSLQKENTYTITTGHQLCLLGGPAYFFYKIIHTIALANQLKADFPQYHFVPVFWLAGEDHDFEEINHIRIYGKDISWNIDSQFRPVGTLPLSNIDSFFEDVKQIFQNDENALKTIEKISNFYLNSKNLSEATRKLVDYFFADYGLVIIDAAHKTLKQLFKEEMKKDISENVSYHTVATTNEQLAHLHFKQQVNPRKINLFYINAKQQRWRIKDYGEYVSFANNEEQKIPKKQIIEELEKHPERFSPNVILRPLYQEKILPNIVYVGGSGEISYWLQLFSTFQKYSISYPVLTVRNSAFYYTDTEDKIFHKYKIKVNAVFQYDKDELIKKILQEHSTFVISSEKQQLLSVFDEIIHKALAIDNQLQTYLAAEKNKLQKTLNTIEKKVLKAEKNKNKVVEQQINKLYNRFFPENVWQERKESFLPQIIRGKSTIDNTLEIFKGYSSKALIFKI